jgi:hypothetical protein
MYVYTTQTPQVRRLRTQLKSGAITQQEYEHGVDMHIAYAIGLQVQLNVHHLNTASALYTAVAAAASGRSCPIPTFCGNSICFSIVVAATSYMLLSCQNNAYIAELL